MIADLADALWWLGVAMNPRCSASIAWSKQCPRTDTVTVHFSERYADWGKYCPDHYPQYEAYLTGPLAKIRSGR